jgi:hypothetical protein
MIGSTPSVDRDGDTINQMGWDTKAFRKNPVVQWAHDHSVPAIGRANKFRRSKESLDFQEIEFPEEGIHPFADMIFSLLQSGFIKMGSVGFIPTKSEQREVDDDEKERFFFPMKFLKQELLEFSIVNVGSNRDALTYLQGKGFKGSDVTKMLSMLDKRVIPYKKYPLDDEDATWNGPKEVAAAEVSDLKVIATWVDAENDEVKSGYKLPHHRAETKNTVWRGVSAAMGALLGARGGVDIPENERKGVFNHLARHYAEFSKDVPEFKEYTTEELMELDFPEDCIECGVAIQVETREQFVHEGRKPLCKECFDKAKEDSNFVVGSGIPLEKGKIIEIEDKEVIAQDKLKVEWDGNVDDIPDKKNEETKDICKECNSELDETDDGCICQVCSAKEYVEEKAGAVLNKANKNKVKEAIRLMSEVLASSESAEEESEEEDTDDKSQPPKQEVSLNTIDILAKLNELVDVWEEIASSIVEEEKKTDLEEKDAPNNINLEEMELPQKEEIDIEMLSKALATLKKDRDKVITSAIRSAIKDATGKLD